MGKKKNEDKIVLKKESALIESSREQLTLTQEKAFNMLLLNAAEQMKKNPNLDRFTIPASTILEYYEIGKQHYLYLKNELKKLEKIIIEYNLLGKDKTWITGAFPLLSSFEYNHGTITYQLPFQIKDRILEHKMYATFGLLATKFFRSKYTLALYEILMDYINSPKVPEMDIETYKKLIGAEHKSYHTYELIETIFKRPVEELNSNKYVPFTVSYKLIRGVRDKIVGVRFELELKDWYLKKLDETITDISPEAKELTALLPERYQTSLVATLIQGHLDQYPYEDVREAIEKAVKEKGFVPAKIEQYLKEKHSAKSLDTAKD
ncbi:MAG: replication initiation protein [Caldisericum sp.]|jgi:hypothetical protein|nr:replication initiation protein [Caldisericum sp.]